MEGRYVGKLASGNGIKVFKCCASTTTPICFEPYLRRSALEFTQFLQIELHSYRDQSEH